MKLTQRQIEILQSVAEGETSKCTAHKLGLVESTVKNHRVNIYRVLNASCAAHAVAIGFRDGLLSVVANDENI